MTSRVLAAVMLVPFVGCEGLVDAVEQAGEVVQRDPEPIAAADPVTTADEQLTQKLNRYIQCTSRTSRQILDSSQRYASWVDPETGVTGTEKNVYGLYRVGDHQLCIEGIKASNESEPDDPDLEAAATAYAEAFAAVQPLIQEAYAYYNARSYKDDGLAKGKALDPGLRAGFKRFADADAVLRDKVRVRNEALLDRELERIEHTEGRKLLFHTKNVVARARGVVQVADVPDFPALDLAAMKPALDAYETALAECVAYSESHRTEASSITMYGSFLGDADDFKAAAHELVERKTAGTTYTRSETARLGASPERIKGHPRKVEKAYNDLIGRSNGLNWKFYRPDP
jgi:hypothetical protein